MKPPDIQILITKLKHVNAVPGKRTVVPANPGPAGSPKVRRGAGSHSQRAGLSSLWAPGARDAAKTLVSPPPAPGPTRASSGPRDGDTFPSWAK